jgi:hypothetical protein
MDACSDEGVFDWIRGERKKLLARDDPEWRGNFVSHLIPEKFEAYAKILHRIEANYENIDSPLSESEDTLLKIPPCKKLRTFVESQRDEHKNQRIRWRTLTELFDVPFEPEICHAWFRTNMEEPRCWPRFLFGPGEGNLDAEEFSELLSIMTTIEGHEDCFFRFAEMPFIGTETPILFRGVLDELGSFLAAGKYQFTPEYWWPANRRWCLCSDYDLTFTIVGGSTELISRLLNSSTLEALEVTPRTRIDNYASIPR